MKVKDIVLGLLILGLIYFFTLYLMEKKDREVIQEITNSMFEKKQMELDSLKVFSTEKIKSLYFSIDKIQDDAVKNERIYKLKNDKIKNEIKKIKNITTHYGNNVLADSILRANGIR